MAKMDTYFYTPITCMESKSVTKPVGKSAITTLAAVIMTAILMGSIVGGAGYVYSTQRDTIAAELKSENGKLSTKVQTSQDETAKLNSGILTIQDDGKKLKSVNDQLSSQIKAVAEDNNKLKSTLELSQADNNKLTSQLGAAKDQSVGLKSSIDQLNLLIKNSEADSSRLKSLTDTLNSRIKTSDEDNALLRSQINDLNNRISDANEKIVALSRSAVATFAFIPKPNIVKVAVPAGVTVRFLKLTTVDGLNLNGALWEPQDKKPNVAILVVPGTGGNYTGPGQRPVVSFVASGLASKGYAALVTDNRGSDQNVGKDNVYDIPKDLGAGVSILKSLGYSNIILLGISLGGQHVVHYETVARDPAVKALILSAAVTNNPWRTRDGISSYLKPADAGLYDRLYTSAKDMITQGKSYAILSEQMPFTPWVRSLLIPVSAMNFISYYSPEGIVTTALIKQVPVPILMVRDQADAQHRSFEAQWLLGNATAPGSQVPSAKLVVLPNPDSPSAAAHTFDVGKNGQRFLDTVSAWLDELRLK